MNRDNIQKVLDHIQKDNGTHFRMKNWILYVNSAEDKVTTSLNEDDIREIDRYVECSTAFCICGLANLLRLEEEGANPKHITGEMFRVQFSSEYRAAAWLGLEMNKAVRLFKSDGENDSDWTDVFDNYSAKIRRTAAINVLTHLLKTGDVDWDSALTKAIGSQNNE